MADAQQPEPDGFYPFWKPTDWTAQQRLAAISGLLFLGVACGLIAFALAVWGMGPLAMDTFIPIGMTELCLGATLLSYVAWYAYQHARNKVGEHVGTTQVAYVMLAIEGAVALISLVLQLLGTVLVTTVGWQGWQGYSGLSYLAPVGVCGVASVCLNMLEVTVRWRPTRDPLASGSVLSAPVTGVRLALRWLVMMVERNIYLLMWATLLALPTDILPHVDAQRIHLEVALGIAGGFFLIAALVEATHRPRAATPAPGVPAGTSAPAGGLPAAHESSPLG